MAVSVTIFPAEKLVWLGLLEQVPCPWIRIVRVYIVRSTVKIAELVPVPAALVTLMGPVVAPAGTVTVICVDEFKVKLDADTPLNFTEVAPVKFVPVIMTLFPTPVDVGVKLETVGGKITVKPLPLEPVP